MTSFLLSRIVETLFHFKYLFLFPIAVIEGPIISIIAGFLIAGGTLNFLTAYCILVLGDLVGDSIYYSIGRWGGRPFVRRWGRIFGLTESRVLSTEAHFQKHPKKTLFLGKTQSWGAVILAAAGLAKMSFIRFIWLNFLATAVKSFALLVIGYYFGQAYVLINTYINYIGLAGVLLAAPIILYLLLRNKKWGK